MNQLDNRELTTLCLCAFRYAIDRETGISFEIADMLMRHKDGILEWARDQIKRDILHKIDRNGFKYEEDLENWKSLRDKL